ncbi:hypothetical protein B0H17DRAFT_1290333 [Mycena rosella]|uniref:Uncharacterized protein n=1 Tax=Mycena rosella TaxID=1033263 RepID=A0AAD7DF79_MYCRO|nr:hypothetical protein B0H17DRAFT_1290333 [Mycena rosella]
MAVAGLILGLNPAPEISFQDAVITIYFISMAWITLMISLAATKRVSPDLVLLVVSSIHTYLTVSFIFAVLATAVTFGQTPECNHEAVAIIFYPFSALKSGRIVGCCIVGLTVLGYTIRGSEPLVVGRWYGECEKEGHRDSGKLLTSSVYPRAIEGLHPEVDPTSLTHHVTATHHVASSLHPEPIARPREMVYDLQIGWTLVFRLFFMVVCWAFFVVHTELVIHHNRPTQGGDSTSAWQFGQILPMFLMLLPVGDVVSSFRQWGLRP